MSKNISNKVVLIITLVMMICLASCGVKGNEVDTGLKSSVSIEQLKTDIRGMIKDIYEPKTIEQFNGASEEWQKRMSAEAHSKLFNQAPISELTEKDLNRAVHINFITLGVKELQSDSVPKILVSFGLINTEAETMINIDIEFELTEDGLINNVITTV